MTVTDRAAIDLLTEAVATPGLCGGEDAVAGVLAEGMTALGFPKVRRDEVGNLHGEAGPDDADRTVMILGHMDTVPGTIPVEVRDGALYGRGSVDAKGPLVTGIVAAACAAQRTGARIHVVGAVQEEGPSVGARHLLHGLAPDAVIIAEPGSWDSIVLGYKGSQRCTIEITVPTTHSAAPEPTAAEHAFDLWSRLRDWCATHPVPEGKEGQSFYALTPTLISLGWEQDGLHETASMYVGLRLPPGITPEEVQAGVRSLAPDACFDFGQGESAVRCERNTPLVSRFVRGIRDEGGKPRFKLKTGTADMNVVVPIWGVPAVAYGPGDSHLDHTPNEHISLDEYLRAVRVLTRVLEES